MATKLSDQLRETLDTTFQELTEAAAAWETSVAEARQVFETRLGVVVELESRLGLVEQAMAQLDGHSNGHANGGSNGGSIPASAEGRRPIPLDHSISAENPELAERLKSVPYSVSIEKLNAVKEYLSQHGDARQADIVREVVDPATGKAGMNSGSVSVALRFLHDNGFIEQGERRDNSQVWVSNTPSEPRTRSSAAVAA